MISPRRQSLSTKAQHKGSHTLAYKLRVMKFSDAELDFIEKELDKLPDQNCEDCERYVDPARMPDIKADYVCMVFCKKKSHFKRRKQ